MGHLERFSPGQNATEVGHQIALDSLPGHTTLEPFGSSENLSKRPEIAKALRSGMESKKYVGLSVKMNK